MESDARAEAQAPGRFLLLSQKYAYMWALNNTRISRILNEGNPATY
jgi:hypothetical protein